ncbi:unnamed protein product [Closterium sp. Yama58-4]|nr:unnamed protein product [Closterium sp. Yama58-4]
MRFRVAYIPLPDVGEEGGAAGMGLMYEKGKAWMLANSSQILSRFAAPATAAAAIAKGAGGAVGGAGGNGTACQNDTCVCPAFYSGSECLKEQELASFPGLAGVAAQYVGDVVVNRHNMEGHRWLQGFATPAMLRLVAQDPELADASAAAAAAHARGEVTDVLPAGQAFNSCAVVGAGGALLGMQLGREIDSHSAVLRCNRARTRGFEEQVGRRTNFRVTDYYSWGFQERDEKVLVPIVSHTTAQGLVTARKRSYTVQTYPIHPSFMQYVTRNAGHAPTAGFIAVMVALQRCQHITLYGFTVSGEGEWDGVHVDVTKRERLWPDFPTDSNDTAISFTEPWKHKDKKKKKKKKKTTPGQGNDGGKEGVKAEGRDGVAGDAVGEGKQKKEEVTSGGTQGSDGSGASEKEGGEQGQVGGGKETTSTRVTQTDRQQDGVSKEGRSSAAAAVQSEVKGGGNGGEGTGKGIAAGAGGEKKKKASVGPGAASAGSGAASGGSGAASAGSGAASAGSGAASAGWGAASAGSGAASAGSGAASAGSGAASAGSGAASAGSGAVLAGSGAASAGSGAASAGSGAASAGSVEGSRAAAASAGRGAVAGDSGVQQQGAAAAAGSRGGGSGKVKAVVGAHGAAESKSTRTTGAGQQVAVPVTAKQPRHEPEGKVGAKGHVSSGKESRSAEVVGSKQAAGGREAVERLLQQLQKTVEEVVKKKHPWEVGVKGR